MASGESVALGSVQRTLLIPLWARAIEAKKRRPIVRDARALEVFEGIDYDFGKFRRAYGTQIGCVLRGLLYDQWVGEFLAQHPAGTVVELGAGLNTRFERVDNGRAHWIDVDLPDTIAMRSRYFDATPRRIFMSASALDADWPARIAAAAPGPYYFVSEGMLMYLAESDVRAMLGRMADAFPGAELALDSIAPSVVRHQRHHDSMKHMMDAPFRWGVDDIHEIEAWDPRFRITDVAVLADIPRRFPRRVPFRYRVVGDVLRKTLPRFTRAYRLARLRLNGR